ncbi:hypothetical protein [Chitinophaga arvensicola]|uniref:Uncharacterized protein n=1 Tax=Chitinophaga arvensicola TaxID=29529 RepID=A0A1I0SB43_9BACT|nr:hypothetical protein [Chitinophaga arvensicola]SEW53946.1 hypothetical protein SAMN04488122_5786 [Chitinophaga arvensicola]
MRKKIDKAAVLSIDNIYPHGLSEEEKAAADNELVSYRMDLWNKMTKKDHLRADLLQVKYQMERVIKSLEYQGTLHFGYFLSAYIRAIQKKQKEFAREISIDEARLSRIIHNKEFPNDELFIRLEIHSNNTIPALNWFLLAEKGKAYNISTNQALRKKEKKNVLVTIASIK